VRQSQLAALVDSLPIVIAAAATCVSIPGQKRGLQAIIICRCWSPRCVAYTKLNSIAQLSQVFYGRRNFFYTAECMIKKKSNPSILSRIRMLCYA